MCLKPHTQSELVAELGIEVNNLISSPVIFPGQPRDHRVEDLLT